MNELALVLGIFPSREFAVRRLYLSDTEFQALCEDYAIAARALERWQDDEARNRQYSQLAYELEGELLEYIEGKHPGQLSQHNG